jgi:hypothetical protein
VRAYCFHDFDTVCDQPTLKLLNVYSSLVSSGVVLGEDVRTLRVLGQVQMSADEVGHQGMVQRPGTVGVQAEFVIRCTLESRDWND